MSKTIKNSFDEKLNFINLYNAYHRICKYNRNKKYLLKADIDIETIICNLGIELKNNEYSPGEYKVFTIYEPKERIIKSLPFRDRIVHQWYIEEFIKPFFVPRFINDTFACIEKRGTHKAVKTLQKYMRIMKRNKGSFYVLKCDIKKFFYNIDKEILFNILKKRMKDDKLINLTKIIIYSNDYGKVGIPIGNYTSQFFANIYMNELDMFVKHELHIKYYCRYMDDFVFLLETKEECKRILEKVKVFLEKRLKLQLNDKTSYFPYYCGVNFCGYKIFTTHILVKGSSKRKIKKKINIWNKKQYSFKQIESSYNFVKSLESSIEQIKKRGNNSE